MPNNERMVIMNRDDIDSIAQWLAETGLRGESEIALLNGFCERSRVAGLPIGRGMLIIDTLHPIYEGRGFRWREDESDEEPVLEFKRDVDGAATASWQSSPFYFLLEKGGGELRCSLHLGENAGFNSIEELRTAGQTDYLAIVHRFAPDAVIGEMDNFAARWTTAEPGGFSDAAIDALRRLTPILGLAIKAASLTRVTETLVEAYLGRDPGQRVLRGRIARGQVDQINAVLWFSDMTGYTRLSETIQSDHLIPLLNDYAEAVILSIQEAGGDVLKLIGDGTLAIFAGAKPWEACVSAMRAERDLRRRLSVLREKRMAEGLPVADIYIGLHVGDVFYGNIGSQDRLDFTIVGPAVNEASRIASMCSSVDRRLLCSSEFAAWLPDSERAKLVSVGRFALRGVSKAQELFTLDPELAGAH